jgi:hypothetical protein
MFYYTLFIYLHFSLNIFVNTIYDLLFEFLKVIVYEIFSFFNIYLVF